MYFNEFFRILDHDKNMVFFNARKAGEIVEWPAKNSASFNDGYVGVMYDLQGQGIPLIIPIDQEQVAKAIQTDTKLSKTLILSILVYTFFSRMFDLMLHPVVKHSIVGA